MRWSWLVVLVACRGSSSSGDAPPALGPNLLLVGTVVTPDTSFAGEVLVEGSTITCVDAGSACDAQATAANAARVDTQGIIAPGMIDTHNHILFDVFDNDDWFPTQVYQDHTQWPNEARYIAMLDVKQCLVNDSQGKPAWCANTPYGTSSGSLRCELERYGELKGLVAGTTSIVGLAGTTSSCFGSIVRAIDTADNGLATDAVQTSALFPPSNPSGVCTNIATGKTTAFLAHVGEGTDAKALAEFATLGSSTTPANCLYTKQTAITHGVAFTATEFATMAQAQMKLIWSPQSNVSLYNATANIPAALDAGITIAIAPDWSMGGSANMLDELRFANAWDDAHFGDRLSSQDLVAMGTTHAAQVLAVDDRLGTLAVGRPADLAVYAGDPAHPYDAILAAHPADVRLVMVAGVPRYGDASLGLQPPQLPAACDAIDVCGTAKFVCIATTDLPETYTDLTLKIDQALVLADAQTPTDGFTFAPRTPLVKCQ